MDWGHCRSPGVIIGTIKGLIKGDTRSSEYSLYKAYQINNVIKMQSLQAVS